MNNVLLQNRCVELQNCANGCRDYQFSAVLLAKCPPLKITFQFDFLKVCKFQHCLLEDMNVILEVLSVEIHAFMCKYSYRVPYQ